MPPDITCPTLEMLRRSLDLDGPMTERERLDIETHVEGCDRGCKRMIEVLLRGDTSAGKDTVAYPLANGEGLSEYALLSPPERPDELGRLGGYRVLKLLGQGGMGAVYLAEDPQLERLVALKVMRPELAANPDSRQRFLREARATAKLKDDHVVAIYQVGEHKGLPFLAMEYLRGESLEQWLARGKKLTVGQLLRVARDITRGLAAAHAKGLIHRDIKPANLWLEAPHGRVKILDFGLARGNKDDMQITQTGTILGTPAYMSPEQGRGEPADARSDLFSFGCVLYRLCTGRLPFNGPTVMAILGNLASKNPTLVTEVNPRIPSELAELAMRLLSKPRDERPASAQAVLQELQAIAPGSRGGSKDAIEKEVEANHFAFNPVPENVVSNKKGVTGHVRAASPPPRRSIPWKWLAIGVLAPICFILAAQIVIRIQNKDGSEIKIEVPKGSKVIVEDKGKVVAQVPNLKPEAKPAVAGDPYRRLAEMVLKYEGSLSVQTAKAGINVTAMKDLPKEPFLVGTIRATNRLIPAQAFDAFEGVYDIPWLELRIDDASGLRHLRDVAIQKIMLVGESLNGDECVKQLGERLDLFQLTMQGASLSDVAVPYLLKMKRLRGLYQPTGSSNLTNAGIKALASHPALEYVGIIGLTPQAAVHFDQLPFLRQINVYKVSDAAVPFLSRLSNAASIGLDGDMSDDAARRLQKALPNTIIGHPAIQSNDAERAALKWALDQKAVAGGFINWSDQFKEVPTGVFMLGPLEFPDDVVKTGASHLRGLRYVHTLRWFGLKNLDDEAEHIAALDSLLSLWLGRTTLTAKGMERLTGLKRLVSLNLMQVPTLTTESLSYVHKFKQLNDLALNGSPVTDSGLAELAKAKGVQNMTIEWCVGPFTGDGIKPLTSMPLLRHLKLAGTPLDASAIEPLKLMTSLRTLDVTQTQLVAADIVELHKALPKCAIVWDDGLIVPGMAGEGGAKQQ
jgi:serine/threonine protein kinase